MMYLVRRHSLTGSQSAWEAPCYYIVHEHIVCGNIARFTHIIMDVPNKKEMLFIYKICGMEDDVHGMWRTTSH